MKKMIIAFTLMGLVFTASIAQELERVTERTKNPWKVATYHVKKGQTIKHGPAEVKYRGNGLFSASYFQF